MKQLAQALLKRSKTLLQFVGGQGLTIVANLLYGLLCVRLLSPGEYAKYVVVFGIMATVLVLMDANFSGTLIPLIGPRVTDDRLIANYVASLRRLSTWIYLVIGTGIAFCFPFLVRNRHWDAKTVTGMIVCILISTWFARVVSAYFPVLMMKGDRPTWYIGQLISSVGTLILLLACYWAHWLGAFQAIVINIIGYTFLAGICFYRSRRLLSVRGLVSREKQRAIVRLALPNVPQAVFFAVQGQLSLLLITYFGYTKGVASVGALGRLGQIFSLVLQANSVLVEPYFAKVSRAKLKASYGVALLAVILLCSTVTLIAFERPLLLLQFLGPQYADLKAEVRIAIGAGAVGCVSGLLWGINTARRFVYWWNVGLGIAVTFAIQIAFIARGDMSTVRGVLMMNLATQAGSLLVNASAGVYGLVRGPREAERPTDDEVSSLEAGLATELYISEEGSLTPLSMLAVPLPEVLDE